MVKEKRKRPSTANRIGEYAQELEALSEELNEALRAAHPSWDLGACCVEALCNVSVAPNEVIVTADLPTSNPDTVKVKQISPDTLEIKAEMKRKVHFREFGITHREGEFQFFRCQTRIPVRVDMKEMKTKFKRGMLEIRLPRTKG